MKQLSNQSQRARMRGSMRCQAEQQLLNHMFIQSSNSQSYASDAFLLSPTDRQSIDCLSSIDDELIVFPFERKEKLSE